MEEKEINSPNVNHNDKKKTNNVAKTFRIIGIVVLSLLVVVASFDFIPIRIGDLSDEDMKYEHGNDWCSYVDDDKKISELVIPGTHDSATQYITMPYYSKTQGSSMQQQLECGYRFFDMRLKLGNLNDEKGLFFVHGPTNARKAPNPWSGHIEFGEVINNFVNFLKQNPKEFIICSIKKENNGDYIKEFQNVLNKYLNQHIDSWYLKNELPSVKDIRNKLVLLRRFDNKVDNNDDQWGLSFLWENQNGTEGNKEMIKSQLNSSYNLFVQDHYEYEIDNKWTSFKNSIKTINDDNNVKDLYVNYLSTKGGRKLGHPRKYASTLNDYFKEFNGNVNRGILVFDYADSDIVKKVLSYNHLKFN